jgi:chloramphenicol 3-O-phosphotransferase
MKLLFLHGAPAAGKLTVAKALLRIVPGRLMDNHAAIDLALTVFDFGAPGFWELVHDVRRSALNAAAEHGVPLLVTTFCYADPEDREQVRQFEEIMQRHGAKLLPVFLHCSREEAVRRVGNPDRAERRKITSGEHLIRELDRYDLTAVPRPDCLKLDTSINPADATARKIVQHLGLDGQSQTIRSH